MLYSITDDVVYKMSSCSNPVIGSAAVKILLLIIEQKNPSVSLQLLKRYKGIHLLKSHYNQVTNVYRCRYEMLMLFCRAG